MAIQALAIIDEMQAKLEIVELLKHEFFEEILKSDQADLHTYFGEEIAILMNQHAQIELSYKENNIGPDGKPHDEAILQPD